MDTGKQTKMTGRWRHDLIWLIATGETVRHILLWGICKRVVRQVHEASGLGFIQTVAYFDIPLHSSAQGFFDLRLRTCSAALVANSNTSLTPSLVLAEHSR